MSIYQRLVNNPSQNSVELSTDNQVQVKSLTTFTDVKCS